MNVGVRAIWLLWRRCRWTLLQDIGLTKEQLDGPFGIYLNNNTNGRGMLESKSVGNFLEQLPAAIRQEVEEAAKVLVYAYRLKELSDEHTAKESKGSRKSE